MPIFTADYGQHDVTNLGICSHCGLTIPESELKFSCTRNKIITTSYVGAVLTTRERNYSDDSDFYAVVWDEEKQKLASVEYATTRFYTYDNHASIDATDEVKTKVGDWLVKHYTQVLTANDKISAGTVSKGKQVRVVRGRKVPLGTTGEVFWIKQVNYDRYGRSWGKETRIGIRDESGQVHWTYAKNVEVINPESYYSSPEAIAGQASRYRTAYHLPFTQYGMLVV